MFVRDACPFCRQRHTAQMLFCPVTGQALAPLARADAPAGGTLNWIWLTLGSTGLMLIVLGVWMLMGTRVIDMAEPISSTAPADVAQEDVAPAPAERALDPTARPTVTQPGQIGPTSTPAPSLTSSPTLTITFSPPSCPGALPARLRTGDRGMVTLDPPKSNRVRENAGTQFRILGQINPGETFVVLEGPACANGWNWWRVRAEKDGLTGWTAEGDAAIYWLVPIATVTP
jgi:hypothetical protein